MKMLNSSSDSIKLRVVFDSNIYLAAFLKPGLSDWLMTKAGDGVFQLCYTQKITKEVAHKLRGKMKIAESDLDIFLNHINIVGILVDDSKVSVSVVRDPADNIILECALTARANLIITMDKDLLMLKTFRGIAIVHPGSFRWLV